MVMTKRFSKQAGIGEQGMALIHVRVGEMGFIWHPRRVDHGIDGEIELVARATGEVLNHLLLVQSKAQLRPFPGEDGRGFHYVCDPKDVDYWMAGNAPVILVCSHPTEGLAWWASIKDEFADPARRRSRRIDFDKERDRFDMSAAEALLGLAGQTTRSLYLRPPPRQETLISNMLSVDRIADTVWGAPAIVRRPLEVFDHMRRAGHDVCLDWVLADGMLFSFRRLDDSPLADLIDGGVEGFDTSEWANTKSPDLRRRFVRLLNQTLADVTADDLRRHSRKHYLFFRPTPDLSARRASTGRSRTGRTVFQVYRQDKDPSQIRFCRHHALDHQFVRFGGEWFLELRPTYHYTADGYRDIPWGPDLVKQMKKRERNPAVRDLVVFWAGFLRAKQTLFGEADRRLAFGDLLRFDVDQGIDDGAWAAPPKDTADESDIPTLFELP
jgi:hypothetical protein